MNESLDRVHPTIRTKACKSIASLAVSAALVMALENVGHTVVMDIFGYLRLCLSLVTVPITASGPQG
jgi:hypothetical protein